MNERILIGAAVALLSALGLWHERRIFEQTRKGRLLAHWFGEARGLWALRGLLAAGVLFGTLLAAGLIRPIEW